MIGAKKTSFTFFLFVAISLCGSATCASETLTMESAVESAFAANPDIQAAIHEFEAQRARAPQAATPPDPEFMIEFDQVPIDTADTERGMTQYMVEQMIPFPSKLVYGYKAEKRAAEAALSKHMSAAQEIRRQVKRSYWDLWRVSEELATDREALAIFRQSKSSSEEAYANLKGSAVDPVRAAVELGEIEARIAILDEERLSAIASLSALMARELDPNTKVAEPTRFPSVPKLSELLGRAKSDRPEINESEKMVDSSRAKLSLAKSQYAPDFTLRWGYIDMPGGMQNAWMGRLGVTVPIWSLSKQRFGVRESNAMLSRARSMRESTLLSTESEIKIAYAKLMAAKKGADIYSGTVVPRSRLLLASTQEAYKNSKGDFLSVVDSIRSLTNARLMLARSKAEAGQAFADLERAVGGELK